MKRFWVELTLYAVALLSLAFSAAAQTPVASDHRLSPSEVKTLVKGASTPEDHMKLAEYFRQEAFEETAAARLHDGRALRARLGPALQIQTADRQRDARSLQGVRSQRRQSCGDSNENSGGTRETGGNDEDIATTDNSSSPMTPFGHRRGESHPGRRQRSG